MSAITASLLGAAAARITLATAQRPWGETVLSLADKDKPTPLADTAFTDSTPTIPSGSQILNTAVSQASGTSATAFSGGHGFSGQYLGFLLDTSV